MEQTKMSFFQRFKNSLTNFDFIVNLVDEKKRKALKYIFIIILIAGIFISGTIFFELKKGLAGLAEYADRDIPNFEINNGQLILFTGEPYYFESQDTLVMFDTFNSLDFTSIINQNHQKNVFIFTSEYAVIRTLSNNRVKQYKYDSFLNGLSKENIVNFLNNNGLYSFYLAIFVLLSYLVYKLFGVLVAWIISMIIVVFKKTELTNSQMFTLTAYALTRPYLLLAVRYNLGFDIPFFFFFYYGTFIYGIIKFINVYNANKDAPPALEDHTFIIEQ